jgi:hypothetical protein
MSVYSPDADLRAAAYNRPTLTEMSHNGSSETSSFIDECWASWFCNLAGNQFFCEVDKAYIEDSFNLFGLKQHLNKDYSKALDAILDRLGRIIRCYKVCLPITFTNCQSLVSSP